MNDFARGFNAFLFSGSSKPVPLRTWNVRRDFLSTLTCGSFDGHRHWKYHALCHQCVIPCLASHRRDGEIIWEFQLSSRPFIRNVPSPVTLKWLLHRFFLVVENALFHLWNQASFFKTPVRPLKRSLCTFISLIIFSDIDTRMKQPLSLVHSIKKYWKKRRAPSKDDASL